MNETYVYLSGLYHLHGTAPNALSCIPCYGASIVVPAFDLEGQAVVIVAEELAPALLATIGRDIAPMDIEQAEALPPLASIAA